MGRGCFGTLGYLVALALLASTIGCGQNEVSTSDTANTEPTSVKTEDGDCCGGCCSEETSEKSDCCGKCENATETAVTSKKECCSSQCEGDKAVLTSAKTDSKDSKPCEHCEGNKACKECDKQKEGETSVTALKTSELLKHVQDTDKN